MDFYYILYNRVCPRSQELWVKTSNKLISLLNNIWFRPGGGVHSLTKIVNIWIMFFLKKNSIDHLDSNTVLNVVVSCNNIQWSMET